MAAKVSFLFFVKEVTRISISIFISLTKDSVDFSKDLLASTFIAFKDFLNVAILERKLTKSRQTILKIIYIYKIIK